MERPLRLFVLVFLLVAAPRAAMAQATPIAFGEPVAGEIAVAGEELRYTFDAVRGQTAYVDQTASSNANGLNWKLSDGWGRTLASNFTALQDLGPVPLLGGTYTVTVTGEGAATGTFAFTVHDAPNVTAIAALGATIEGSIDVPGRTLTYELQGANGQVLFVDQLTASAYYALNWRLTDPLGRVLADYATDLRDMGPFPLMDGTYVLDVRGEGSTTGTFTAQLATPVDGGGAFAVGEDVSGEITTPGQVDQWTFTATAGQRIALDLTGSSNVWGLNWSLESGAGRVVLSRTTDLNDKGPFVLESGVHTITIMPEGDSLGTYSFRVVEVTDGGEAITIGQTVVGEIALAGQRQVYTFTAAPGTVVSLDQIATSANGVLNWHLVDAVGRDIVPRTANLSDVVRLPLVGGDYTLTILGEGGNTGTFEFRVAELMDDLGAVSVGGSATGAIEAPGDTDSWSFTAAAGQIVSLDMTATSNVGGLNWDLRDAHGRPVLARTANLNDVGPFTLFGGSYTITVYSENGQMGTYSFDLVDGGTGTYTPAGTPIVIDGLVAGSIDAPGEVDSYVLTVPVDTRLYADLLVGAAGLRWALYDTVGQAVFGPVDARYPDSQDAGPWTLAAGDYQLDVFHGTDGTGAYELRIGAVVDEVGTFAPEDIVAGTIATPGAVHTYTFDIVTEGDYFLDLLVGGNRLYWSLADQAGGDVFASTIARYPNSQNQGPWTLTPGTYTLVLDPQYADVPAYEFQLRTVSDSTTNAAVGDTVAGTFTVPGERHEITFDVAQGQRVYIALVAGAADLFWTLEDALGNTIFDGARARYAGTDDQGPFLLPAGTCRLVIDPRNDTTPSYEFQLLEVSDTNGTFNVGDIVSGTFAAPGVLHRYTFSLGAPSTLYFDNLLGAINTYWTLSSDRGEDIFADVHIRYTDTGDRGPLPLPAGDYTLTLRSDGLPAYEFQVVETVDTAAALLPNTVTPGSIQTPGGTATFTFEVTVNGRTVVLDLQEASAGLQWTAWDEVGAPLFTTAPAADVQYDDQGPFPLAAGTYTVRFSGEYDAVGPFSVQAFQYVEPVLGDCAEGAEPTPERCDGVDNDCDGLVDEEDYGNWDIYQGGALLGPVTTLETFESVQVFYSYGLGFGSSYNGATLPPVAQESLIFVHRNLLDDELSFVIVHDQPADADGGQVNFEIRNMGLSAYVAQADDPGEVGDQDFDGAGNAYFQWVWSSCCTDGVAIADIDWAQCITVIPDFVSGIDVWSYLTDDVYDPRRVPLSMTDPLSVCPSTCAACPPPDAAGGQVPTPVAIAPAPGSTLPEGQEIVLSGEIPAFPTRPIRAVIVNGLPAQVDAGGRFWAPATVTTGDNTFVIEVVERCGVSTTEITLVGETPDQASALGDVTTSLSAEYRDTTFNDQIGRLFVDVRATASGDDAVVGPALMVIGPQLDPTVTLENLDGRTEAGEPYLALLGDGVTLAPGETTEWRALSFDDPDRLPVRFETSWLGRGNRAPAFATAPLTVAASERPYEYAAHATDPDGHALGYTLEAGPGGMTVEATTGLVTWSPGPADIGRHEVALAASDGFGGRTVQRYSLTVEDGSANRPPVFVSIPPVQVPIGDAYTYDAEARDDDGDALTYTLTEGPAEAVVDPTTGLVSWPFALPGAHPISVLVEDGRGGSARQSWLLAVGELPENPGTPQITSVPPTDAAVGDLYLYQPVAYEPDGDMLTWSLDAGPIGMDIDPLTGRLTWFPEMAHVGDHPVTLSANDGLGGVATQSYTVTVSTEPANRPPYFATAPSTVALAGQLWSYPSNAVDPEFGLVTYELVAGPVGMSVDGPTGLVTWTPTLADVGEAVVALRAVDLEGATGSQVFVLTVRETNAAPQIVTSPAVTGTIGETYRYDVHALDADGDTVTYGLDTGPAGASFDTSTGLLLWPITAADTGDHSIVVSAEDAYGGRDEQSWTLTVTLDETPPTVVIAPARAPACVDEPVTVCVNVSDDVGVTSRTLTADTIPVALDGAGCATFLRDAPTVIALAATALDPTGNEGAGFYDLTFANCNDTERPVVEIHQPAPGAVLTGPAEIIATISDNEPAALTWTVSRARVGTDDFEEIGAGTGPVTEDVVALFDTTLLANDSYRIQILASDGLQTGGVEFLYGVGGGFKLGNVRISFTDLLVPVAGIPLSVTRHYDSLDTTPGDFGAGWRLGLSGKVTDDAEETPDDDLGSLLGGDAFTRTSRVYVTKPNGTRVGFTFEPTQLGFPTFLWVTPAFTPDEGVTDELSALDGPPAVLDAGGRFYNFIIPYNPNLYALKTAEGITYVIDEVAGLQRIEDAYGNTLEVTPDGITSSTGISLTFQRDGAGRITEIVTPDPDPNDALPAPTLQYEYDELGNLTGYRDTASVLSTYHYADARFPHYLTSIEDPLGRPVLRYVFADDGRVIGACDAAGDPVTLEGCEQLDHDVAGGLSTLVDANGNRTDLFYDERGNIVVEREWLDDVDYIDTERIYDEGGNTVSETLLPEGTTRSWTYDGAGNPLTHTDAGGRTWTFEYAADCTQSTRSCDPLGNCTVRDFDEACNALGMTDALGNTTSYEYTTQGALAQMDDPVGNRWTFTYGAGGTLTAVTDPRDYAATMSFDAAGKAQWKIDRNGRRVDYVHDEAGRLATVTWDSEPPRVTQLGYDDAGQLVSAVTPDSTLAVAWTVTGRVQSVDSTGTPDAPAVALSYEYDGNGNVTAVVDSLGGRTEYDYDALDRVVAIRQSGTGVDAKAVTFSYVGHDDAVREIHRFADLEATQGVVDTWFDLDCGGCGTRVSGVRHRSAADPSVVFHDILLDRDDSGNVVAMTDLEGLHVFSNDGARRLVSVDHPDGGLQPDELYRYDAAGNRQESHLSATYGYGYESGLGGNQLLSDDTYDYEYDAEGNLVRRTERSSGAYVQLGWDHANRLTSLTAYDAGGVATTEASYRYDAAGRRIRSEEDGVVRHYVYDGQNPILVLDDGGGIVARRLYAQRIDRILAEDRDGTTRWFLTDHLGTVRDLVDDTGTVLAHYHYDAFGQSTLPAPPALANDLGFTAREQLPEGLAHFRRRVYAPNVGRFVQEDPLRPWQYPYADNAPLLFSDPTGQMAAVEYALLVSRLSNLCDLLGSAGAGAIGAGPAAVFEGVAMALQGGEIDVAAIIAAMQDSIESAVSGPLGICGGPAPGL